MLVLSVVVIATLLCGGSCQSDEQCLTVRAGLQPVLNPCRESVQSCVESDISFSMFTGLFCVDGARTQFNNFLQCEGRPFTDQIFGAICGGPNCAGDQPFSACQPTEGERCYDEAVVSRNLGAAAFDACLCSNESQSSTDPECPAECGAQLQELVEDVGCCVNTALYSFYFSTCGDSDGGGTDFQAPVDILNSLFDACDISLPASCLHPFSSSASKIASGVFIFFIAFSLARMCM